MTNGKDTDMAPSPEQTRRLLKMRKREYVAVDQKTGVCQVQLPWGTLWLKRDGRDLKRQYRND